MPKHWESKVVVAQEAWTEFETIFAVFEGNTFLTYQFLEEYSEEGWRGEGGWAMKHCRLACFCIFLTTS